MTTKVQRQGAVAQLIADHDVTSHTQLVTLLKKRVPLVPTLLVQTTCLQTLKKAIWISISSLQHQT